jgi:hypothetical protein
MGARCRVAYRIAVLAVAVLGVGAAADVVTVGGTIDEEPSAVRAPAPVAGDETVVARGESPIGGPWEMRLSTSSEISYGGEVAQPAGLICVQLVLLDPPAGTPQPGGGQCGEFGRSGLGVLDLPVRDRSGRVEVILYGRAPDGARSVELRAVDTEGVSVRTFEGPPGVPGDFWLMSVPHDLRNPRVDWLRAGGTRAGVDLDAAMDLERGKLLASMPETP